MYFNTAKANKMIIGNKVVIGEFSLNAVSLNNVQTIMSFGDKNINSNIAGKVINIGAYKNTWDPTASILINMNTESGNLNFTAAHSIYLGAKELIKLSTESNVAYGNSLPTTNNETGRIFFKIVD